MLGAARKSSAAEKTRVCVGVDSPAELICPADRSPLVQENGWVRCTICRKSYGAVSTVLRFLEQDDAFYEGAYQNRTYFLPRSEKPWHIWPLWLINSGWVWCVRKRVRAQACVVELGCAGGVAYFGRRYHMVGVDVSGRAVATAAEVYERCLQADAGSCIPVADASVDAVVSSYFWEHVRPTEKPAILKECHRILKPGGKLVFLYDVETENPLIRRYKQEKPALYEELFIKGDGHLGYETPAANLNSFREAGFRVVVHKGMEKTWLQSPSCYSKLAQFGGAAGVFFRWCGGLGRPPWFYLYTALTRVVDTFICAWLPQHWARIDLVVCEKDQS